MFDRSDLTESRPHVSPHTDIIIIYRFTEVSPCPMANNVLGVVYSNKKIAASAPGWVQAGYLGMGPWGPEHTLACRGGMWQHC